jgi:hypothetical protein
MICTCEFFISCELLSKWHLHYLQGFNYSLEGARHQGRHIAPVYGVQTAHGKVSLHQLPFSMFVSARSLPRDAALTHFWTERPIRGLFFRNSKFGVISGWCTSLATPLSPPLKRSIIPLTDSLCRGDYEMALEPEVGFTLSGDALWRCSFYHILPPQKLKVSQGSLPIGEKASDKADAVSCCCAVEGAHFAP